MAVTAEGRNPHASLGAGGGTAVRLIAVLVVAWSATDAGPSVKVPRGPAPVIDGRMDSAEWAGAAVEQLANGLTVRLRHDGQFLFLAVSSSAEGFPSVCVARADTVRILHASAALGAVAYTRRGGGWSSTDTAFTYGMRNTALTEGAREERRAYLAQHGWVASTARMGLGRNHELQIALALTGPRPRIALGYFRMAGEGDRVTWPASLTGSAEGCAELRLIQGWVAEDPRFDPTLYPELELAP
jgi:hypothetical protein